MNNEEQRFFKLTPFKMQVLQSFPFIDADFDALTNYELLCKVVEYLNTTVDNVNLLHDDFITLYNYVHDYFDNLDVQEEINNKLDQMASDGTFTNLISNYVDPIQEAFENEVDARIDAQDTLISNRLLAQDNKLLAQDEEIDRIGNLVEGATSGSPLVASSTSDMTDTSRIYVNTSDGNWYYYDGDSWEIGGTYQSAVDSETEESNRLIISSASNKVRLNYAPTFTADKRLDASGNLYTQSGCSTSDFLPYSNCFAFRITLPSDTTNAYICYYNSSHVLIGSRHGLDSGVNNNNNIPDNTAYIRYCCLTSELASVQASAESLLNDRITKLEKNTNLYLEVNTQNKYIATNVDVGSAVTLTPTTAINYRYIIYNCQEGDLYRIKAKGGITPRLWAFIDSSNNLISKSEQIDDFSTNYCVAPRGAVKVIFNFYLASLSATELSQIELVKLSSYNAENMENAYNIADDVGTYGFIDVSANVGETVDLTPTTAGGWEYFILPVSGISQVYIAGKGGTSPRLWAFIDSSSKLITKSSAQLTYDGIVDVPYNAYKLIVNYQTSYKEVLQIVAKPNLAQLTTRTVDIENKLAKDYEYTLTSPDEAMCSAVRGLKLRDQLNNPLTDFKKSTDTMVHVSTFKIVDDNVFVTYFASNTSVVEDPQYQMARFVKAPLNNLDNQTYYDIISVGDTFDSKEVTALYDTILVKVDDDTLYIMICLMLDNRYNRVYIPYTISTGEFGDMAYNYFRVGSTRMVFNTQNMNTLLNNAGIPHNDIPNGVKSEDIGIMQKFTPHVEDDVTYQYGGVYVGTFNCIVKTTDFITFDYVAQPTWAGNYWVENSVYVIGDIAYYYLRQRNNEQAGILSRYYINENRWDTPVYVPDAQSRGDFLKVGDNLYLFHNKNSRYTMSVLKVNSEYLNRSYDYIDASVNFMHYPYSEIYNGTIYTIYSQSRSHIYFTSITMGDSNDTICNNLYNKIYN